MIRLLRRLADEQLLGINEQLRIRLRAHRRIVAHQRAVISALQTRLEEMEKEQK